MHMHMLRFGLVAVVLAGAGCGGKGDDCQRFWDKSAPITAKAAGKPVPADAKDKFLKECREGDRMKKDPTFKCVLDASGDDAVAACMSKAFGAYANKSKATEAKLHLNKLGKNAKVFYMTESTFPVGKAGPTPAEPCCKAPGQKCAPNPAQWEAAEPWKLLDFMIDDEHRFQYSYESDGKTVTAAAVGDSDCDGTTVTYKLEMKIENDAPTMNIVDPTTED